MRPIGLALSLLALAACQQAAAPAAAPSTAAAPAAAALTPPTAPAPVTIAREVSEENDVYVFKFSYPAPAAAIPALRDWLEANLAKGKAGVASEAHDASAEAKAQGYPFNLYYLSTEWKVVTDLPGWLSLSAFIGSYSGGAHGMAGFDAVLWDKRANTRRAAADLFTGKAALKAAVLKPFCAALTRERAKKRDGAQIGDPSDMFNECIDPIEQTIILGSSNRKGFDRIGFLIDPYIAGPYAEGSYEVTLPVTAAVLGVVKPEYRAAFVAP